MVRTRRLVGVLLALVVAGCGMTGPTPSPHSTVPLASAPRPVPGHEVYGYAPYWEMDDGLADHVAKTDLTTLALFSITHRKNGSMNEDENGFRHIDGPVGRRLLDEAHERGVRVELVYTSFGADKNRAFFGEGGGAAQERWIDVLVGFAAERGFDGINVDVESLPPDLLPSYGGFVGRLREALRARVTGAEVSVATGAGELGAAMAAAATLAGADRIFLMGYDYRTAESEPGASAPLERSDGGFKSLAWSLDLYAALGVPVERTILGLPLYGVTWPVAGPEFGAFATGRGDTWVPRRNLPTFADPTFAATYEPTESVEFFAQGPRAVPGASAMPGASAVPGSPSGSGAPGSWTAVYFDSPRSLRPKLALADARGLAGAGFWAIGYERGLPDYTRLIASFRAGELQR